MSRIALLSRSEFSSVKRGGQVYSQYLQKAFPTMQLINLDQCPPLPKIMNLDLNRFCLEEVKKSWWLCRHFSKLHKENPFDLVITYAEEGWPFAFKNLSIPRLQIYMGCFSAYADHVLKKKKGYFASRYLYAPFEKLSGHQATCVSISGRIQKEIGERYHLESQMIPVGIELERFPLVNQSEAQKKVGVINPSKPVGLFVGQAQYGKGWDIIEQLAKKFPHVQFVCLLSQRITNNHSNIICRYDLSNEDLCLLYNAADFFIFPSRYESAALVVLEAMACNLPVIISQAVANVCIDDKVPLGESQGVYVIHEDQAEKYAEAIQKCIAKKSRSNTRSYVEENRSFLNFKQKFDELIGTLLL